MGNAPSNLDTLFSLLAGVDETYAQLPADLQLDVSKITQSLAEFGPRKLRRKGPGMDFFESRDFRPETDEPRRINAKISVRAGRPMVIEREAEIRQQIYLWRDGTPSMDYTSVPGSRTKKAAAETMLLALAKHLGKNEDMIGILDAKGLYRGGKSAEVLAHQLTAVNIITGDMPTMERRLPRYSTVVLFSDFFMSPDNITNGLSTIEGQGLHGHLVMVLDPQEINFAFSGNVNFNGMKGEGTRNFKKAENKRAEYQNALKDRIEWLDKICADKGFTLTIQRTDEPLHHALLSIYGLPVPRSGPAVPGLGL